MRHLFTRTPTGLVGSRYFFQKPILWVEGSSDIYFYEPLVGDLECTIKPFNGFENSRALIEGLRERPDEYPYAVVLDGDYRILSKQRSVHRWVIALHRYSFENYLWQKESLNRSCLKHSQCHDQEDAIGDELQRLSIELESILRPLLELDIAAKQMNPAPKVMPGHIGQILVRSDSPNLCPRKVERLVNQVSPVIPDDLKTKAKTEVDKFLVDGEFTHLINGHLLLGVLHRLFTVVTTRIRGKKSPLSEDALVQLLADMVWRTVPSKHHSQLRRKLRSVVKELCSRWPMAIESKCDTEDEPA